MSASHAFCAQMVTNNAMSGNFQALIRRLIDMLYLVCRPKAPAVHVHQACALVFLLRLFLKHMIESLSAADLDAHLLDPTSSTSLAGPLVEALLTVLVQCECNDDSYWLHMEAAAALCVCMSTQLFSHLSDPTPQPLVTAALTSGGPGAELLVSRLLHYIIKRPPPPAQPTGILRRIGSAAKSVLLLPYYTISYLSYYLSARKDDAEGDVRLELADRALQLLLLLTQHLPPALFSPETYPTNPFLEALRSFGDERPFDAPTPADVDESAAEGGGAIVAAEQGRLRASRVPFKELHDAIAALLPEQGAALLLYTLLHGNRDFLDYSLSRTDPETVLVPLLRVLHDSKTLPINRLYMLLILILMLSQDAGFVTAAQTTMLPSVPWYKDRIIGKISVGSLMVILLVKTVQHNLAGAHDSAADGLAEADESAEALQMAVDFLRISLEAINLCLTAGPALNEHLVYAMLERQSIFAPLRSHELFSDLVENIDVVLEHFGATLRTHPDSSDAGGDSVWSVDAVLSHIRAAARDWRADRMRPLQDLRFTYEQEPSPEEFFTPYLWSVVFNSSELGWNADTVLLFNADDGGAPLLDAVDSDGVTGEGLPLPALSSIDVADAESSPRRA